MGRPWVSGRAPRPGQAWLCKLSPKGWLSQASLAPRRYLQAATRHSLAIHQHSTRGPTTTKRSPVVIAAQHIHRHLEPPPATMSTRSLDHLLLLLVADRVVVFVEEQPRRALVMFVVSHEHVLLSDTNKRKPSATKIPSPHRCPCSPPTTTPLPCARKRPPRAGLGRGAKVASSAAAHAHAQKAAPASWSREGSKGRRRRITVLSRACLAGDLAHRTSQDVGVVRGTLTWPCLAAWLGLRTGAGVSCQ